MRKSPTIRLLSLSIFAALAISLTACGAATTATTTDAPAGTTSAADGTGVGGDEPNIVYTSPSGAFSFSHPQSWSLTTQPGETVRYTGRDEFISVTVVTTTLSAQSFATADQAPLAAASPGFQGRPLASVRLNAADSVMAAYTWNAGPSLVTGKLVPSSANRLYIPGPNGTLAAYTYSAPSQVYDPAGAADFANAFRWR